MPRTWMCLVPGFHKAKTLTILALTTAIFLALGVSNAIAGASSVPGELLVGFTGDTSARESRTVVDGAGAQIEQRLSGDTAVVTLEDGVTLAEAKADLKASGNVEYVEPNYIVKSSAMTNDPLLLDGTLWGIMNISAPTAWNTANGSGTVVAVIDSGISAGNPELSTNLWHNPGEAVNGADDDGNGIVNDTYGADFADGDGNPDDGEGHGTHVAGTIAGAGNNGFGVVGVSYGAQVMALKFLDSDGAGTISDAVAAIDYAVANGANVINASWGGPSYSHSLENAIVRAGDHGVLVAVAAGNEGVNNDSTASYPASFSLDNMISVAATDENESLADYSNYGRSSVDLAAPGSEITSTVSNHFESWSGTSMSTPHVAGAAALLKSHAPAATPAQIISALRRGSDKVDGLDGKVSSGGSLDVASALVALDDPNYNNIDTNSAPSRFRLKAPGRRALVGRSGKLRFKWSKARDTDLVGYAIYVDGKRRAFVSDPDGAGPALPATHKSVRVHSGNHRWQVVAVDAAGHKRKASRGSNKGKVAVVRDHRRK